MIPLVSRYHCRGPTGSHLDLGRILPYENHEIRVWWVNFDLSICSILIQSKFKLVLAYQTPTFLESSDAILHGEIHRGPGTALEQKYFWQGI